MKAFKLFLEVFLCFETLHLAKCCKFDSIVDDPVNIPKLFVNYGSRSKRDVKRYVPLRFHIQTDQIKFPKEILDVVKKATSKVSQLLHVAPVEEPILLERTSCLSVWSQGPNKGRCSSLRGRPQEELCENKIDGFTIPDDHLQRLDVYNYSGSDPIFTLPAGQGAKNADYILYVKSKYTSMCEQGDVQAYASYCRLDQFSRPIAGLINFCPSASKKKAFDADYFMNVAVHELFHALGFSKDLFLHYRGCPIDSPDCDNMDNYLTSSFGNYPRLIYPSVVEHMKLQFDCSFDEFGAPLDQVNGSLTSHWDPLFLYGSIMSPSLDDPEYVYIDQITLAALADSGWYKVDYESADQYFWGIGEGCEFGLKPECTSKGSILCNANDSVPGCDMMHYTQTKCEKVSSSHICGVYKPDSTNDCRNKLIEVNGQHLHHLRCFVMQNNQEQVFTTCAAYHCSEKNDLTVLMNEAWVSCSTSKNDSVNLFQRTLHCPRSDVVCSGEDHMQKDRVRMPVHSSANILTFSVVGNVQLFLYFILLFSTSFFH